MTREEIIALARECGAPDWWSEATDSNVPGGKWLTAFFHAAQALEREAYTDQVTAAELKRLHDYDTRLTAVMPADFKDWHENSRNEWPEIAADVITSLRERENEAWKEAERLFALADKWNAECDEFREDNKRLASERDKPDALLRQLVRCDQSKVQNASIAEASTTAIKQHLGEPHGN